MPPSPAPQQSLLGGIGQFLGDNSATLLALGAGLAGAPSLGTGLSRGFAGAAAAAPADRQKQSMNLMATALMRRGLSQQDAMMIASNPEAAKEVWPQILGSKKLGVVNNRLVDMGTGDVVRDLSDEAAWKTLELIDPTTQEKYSAQQKGSTGEIREILRKGVQPAQGRPAPAGSNIPDHVRALPRSQQFSDAPDGSTALLGGKPVVRRNGRWEYQ